MNPGGIANPMSGATRPVVCLIASWPSIYTQTLTGIGPNFAATGSVGWYDEISPYLYAGETTWTGSAGLVGVPKDLKFAAGAPQHLAVSPDGTKCSILCLPTFSGDEGSQYVASSHLSMIVPWTGSVKPNHQIAYYGGTEFYIP